MTAADRPDFRRLGDLLTEAGLPVAEPACGSSAVLQQPSTPVNGPGFSPALGAASAADESNRATGHDGTAHRPGSPARASAPVQAAPPREKAPPVPGRPLSKTSSVARRIASVWAEAVGGEIAANAQPRQLRNGRLVVSASSPAWAQTLQFMGEDIRRRLNDLLGEEVVSTTFFRHAGWEMPPGGQPAAYREEASAAVARMVGSRACNGEGSAPNAGGAATGARAREAVSAPAPETLDREQRSALASVETLGLAPDLAETIARAMRTAFARQPAAGPTDVARPAPAPGISGAGDDAPGDVREEK